MTDPFTPSSPWPDPPDTPRPGALSAEEHDAQMCRWCGDPPSLCEDPDGHAMYDRVAESTWWRRWAA